MTMAMAMHIRMNSKHLDIINFFVTPRIIQRTMKPEMPFYFVDSAYYHYFRSYTYATLKATLTRK